MHTDVLIIDGSNAAHRFKAVLPPLNGPHGERVEIMLGLLRMISSTVRNNPAQEIFICWDGDGSKQIRLDIDPEYKANRTKNDFEMRADSTMHKQVGQFWDLFGQYLPLTWVNSTTYEADDLIAMLVHACKRRGEKALIVTNDKDMLQLIDPLISMYCPTNEKYCTMDNFEEFSKGFPNPSSHLLAKILMGDSSDNIKGVGGVGDKTAIKILSEHGWVINNLVTNQNAALAKSKVGKNILAGADRIRINEQLMSLTLPYHHKPNMKAIEFREGTLNVEAFRKSLAKMEFMSILASFTSFIKCFEYQPEQQEMFAAQEEETF